MKLAMIGLGKMGANMVRRLQGDGHEVIAYDVDNEAAQSLAQALDGVEAVSSLDELIKALPQPRVIWL
ncbi:MAG TPA: 6-phosphogluconate dehydrogenase, partial [Gammaproteobacteria bacterium]|nr:6-phosphogluconate dehydrogenase [Gammaproteobacteria bacterium]